MKPPHETSPSRILGIAAAAVACTASLLWLDTRGSTPAAAGATRLDSASPSSAEPHGMPEAERRSPDEGLARQIASAPFFEPGKEQVPSTDQGSTWHLRLSWSDNGAPVEAAPVGLDRLVAGTWRTASMVALTDRAGEVGFEGLEPGTWRIACELGGQVVRELEGGAQRDHVILERGPSLIVAVRDEHGDPVRGAAIWLMGLGRELRGAPVGHSGPDGTLDLAGVGRARFVAAVAPGHAPSFAEEIPAVGSDASAEVLLEVRRNGASILGRVLNVNGDPCAGAAVEVRMGHARAHRFEAEGIVPPVAAALLHADGSGRFAWGSLPTGEVPLAVRGRDGGSWIGFVRLEADRETPVEIRLEPGVVIRGRVTHPDQTPVDGAEVRAVARESSFEARALTQRDGSYELRDVPQGPLEMLARDDEGGSFRGEVHSSGSGDCTWDAQLEEVRSLHGRVVDAQREPLAGWTLRVTPSGAEATWIGWGTTEGDGAFSIPCPEFAGDSFDVQAIVPGASGAERERFADLVPSDAPHLLVVTADPEPEAWVVGTVDGPAQGVVRLKVSAQGAGPFSDGVAETTLAQDGAFQLGPLAAGSYELWAHGPDVPATRVAICSVDGAAPRLDLGRVRLEEGGTLALAVSDESASQTQVLTLWIRMQDGTRVVNEQLEVGADGRYHTERVLAPGTYLLRAALLDGYRLVAGTPEVEFEITSGQHTPVTAQLRSEQL